MPPHGRCWDMYWCSASHPAALFQQSRASTNRNGAMDQPVHRSQMAQVRGIRGGFGNIWALPVIAVTFWFSEC
jgi:hypothetical protein